MPYSEAFRQKLKDIGALREGPSREVIYGITDTSRDSLATRLRDFFVDRQKVSLQDKSYFFHLLSVMLDAGVPVQRAVATLAAQTKHERFRRVLNTVSYFLSQGRNLSESMEKFPRVFSETEVGVVRSGESIGRVDQMLARLSSKLTQEYELTLKVKTAMMYPVTVLIALFAAIIVVMLLVMPTLQSLFAESHTALPLLTQWFIATTHFLGRFWWAFVMLGVLGYMAYLSYRETDEGRFRIHTWKLTFPVFGPLLKKIYLTRFVSVFGLLVTAGISVTKALKTTSEAIANDLYRRKILEVSERVATGERLSPCLAEAPFLFPETVTQMLQIGEQTASIDKATEKIAEHYDREVDHAIRRITSLFEPIMIVVVGFFVAVLAIAILGPIFSLSEVI